MHGFPLPFFPHALPLPGTRPGTVKISSSIPHPPLINPGSFVFKADPLTASRVLSQNIPTFSSRRRTFSSMRGLRPPPSPSHPQTMVLQRSALRPSRTADPAHSVSGSSDPHPEAHQVKAEAIDMIFFCPVQYGLRMNFAHISRSLATSFPQAEPFEIPPSPNTR